MLDSNGSLDNDSDLKTLLTDSDLLDLHQQAPAPSTYTGKNNRRVDHMLGCQHTATAMTASGSLAFLPRRTTIRPSRPLRGPRHTTSSPKNLVDTTIPPASMRNLKSGNPESVEAYNKAVLH